MKDTWQNYKRIFETNQKIRKTYTKRLVEIILNAIQVT